MMIYIYRQIQKRSMKLSLFTSCPCSLNIEAGSGSLSIHAGSVAPCHQSSWVLCLSCFPARSSLRWVRSHRPLQLLRPHTHKFGALWGERSHQAKSMCGVLASLYLYSVPCPSQVEMEMRWQSNVMFDLNEVRCAFHSFPSLRFSIGPGLLYVQWPKSGQLHCPCGPVRWPNSKQHIWRRLNSSHFRSMTFVVRLHQFQHWFLNINHT